MGGLESFDDISSDSLQAFLNLMEHQNANTCNSQQGSNINCPPSNGNNIFHFNGVLAHEEHALLEAMDHGLLLKDLDYVASAMPSIPSSSDTEQPWSDHLWTSHDLPAKHHNFVPESLITTALEKGNSFHLQSLSVGTSKVEGHPTSASAVSNVNGSSPKAKGFSKQTSQLKDGYSSDEIDNLDDEDEGSKSSQSGRSAESKTLISERRRRGRLNERLYTLRALVPKITKMDKASIAPAYVMTIEVVSEYLNEREHLAITGPSPASIVGDAISYVQDLQKQVKEIQAEIAGLQSNITSHDSTPKTFDSNSLTEMDHNQMQHDDRMMNVNNPHQASTRKEGNKAGLKILEIDVSKVEERTFYLRIYCKKDPGLLIKLIKALESLQLDYHNANLTSFDGHIIKTVTIKIKNWDEAMDAETLKRIILDAASKYGFQKA